MLQIFRRHQDSCKFAKKGRKHRHCNCPIAVEGRLRGKMIRKSLDVRSWEAAQGLVREMEIVGQAVPTVKEASGRFIEYQESRRLSPDTIQKFRLLFSEWELKGPINTITPDDVSKIVE